MLKTTHKRMLKLLNLTYKKVGNKYKLYKRVGGTKDMMFFELRTSVSLSYLRSRDMRIHESQILLGPQYHQLLLLFPKKLHHKV